MERDALNCRVNPRPQCHVGFTAGAAQAP
jgi:hypothetical protein